MKYDTEMRLYNEELHAARMEHFYSPIPCIREVEEPRRGGGGSSEGCTEE